MSTITGIDKIIGICGQSYSGKTTARKAIVRELPYLPYSFADPLKEAVSKLFMIPLDTLNNQVLKRQLDPRWNLTPQDIMRTFGTEAMRGTFSSHFWLIQAALRLELKASVAVSHKLCVVIDDVRFPNEISWIHAVGGYVIYIHRAETDIAHSDIKALHPSEQITIPSRLSPRESIVYNRGLTQFEDDILSIARRITYES